MRMREDRETDRQLAFYIRIICVRLGLCRLVSGASQERRGGAAECRRTVLGSISCPSKREAAAVCTSGRGREDLAYVNVYPCKCVGCTCACVSACDL